jgi:acyl carrier protein/acetyltransferase-like isoleucine patch superfamily enzyme
MLGRAIVRATIRALDAARAHVALASATRVGADVRVFGWPSVASEGELIVERGVVIVASPSPVEILVALGATLTIGEGAVLESGATLRVSHRVVVGRSVRVGRGCVIDDDGSGADGIEIGDDAWLDDGALVLGDARIAARARVTCETALVRTSTAEVPDAARSSRLLEDDSRLRHVVARVVPGALDVSCDADLRHIAGWDSLAALRVLVALEKEFRVTLPQDLFATEHSLESLVPLLETQGRAS